MGSAGRGERSNALLAAAPVTRVTRPSAARHAQARRAMPSARSAALVCLALVAAVVCAAAQSPPYLPETAIWAGVYSAPFDGVVGTFMQYFSFGSFSWRQDVTIDGENSTVLFTDGNIYIFSSARGAKCSVYSGFGYPLPPLALATFTFFGPELINYTAYVDHWAGALVAPSRTQSPDVPLYVSAYFDQTSMQPVRWISYASLPDHSSEVYDYSVWDFAAPPAWAFVVPKACAADGAYIGVP